MNERKKLIKEQLNHTLKSTSFDFLGEKIKGKVRDIYEKNNQLFFITTDRQSAFDRNLAYVPFKGQILTQVSTFWFKKTKSIIPNHFIKEIDPNIMLCKKLKIFPIEFVIRGYLTGVTSTSVWTAYEKGEREFCGNTLPENMKKNEPFSTPIITPTTKDEIHDEKITPEKIIEKGIMSEKDWEYCKTIALKLFKFGQEQVAKNGLILVDTKYEMGYDEEGHIYLSDEVHTPDSSRYWLSDTYEKKLKEEKEPDNIDKEFLRLWFKEHSDPYQDKTLPPAPQELVIELSCRYIDLYEKITGKKINLSTGNPVERMTENLKRQLANW